MILETIFKYRVMKTINTLSVLFFLFIAVACSSESDTIMNDIDKEIQATSEEYVAFDLSFATASGITTRSSKEETSHGEESVTSCYIAVFNEASDEKDMKLLASYWYTGDSKEIGNSQYNEENKTHTYPLNQNITIKVDPSNCPDLRFVAVAQAPNSKDVLKSCSTYRGLMDCTLNDDPAVSVKFGFKKVTKGEYKEKLSGSVINNTTPISVVIPVTLRAAAIELESFKSSDFSRLEVKKVQLVNMVRYTKVGGTVVESEDDYDYIMNDSEYEAGHRFHAYANPEWSELKTALLITFLADGVEYQRSYTIKTPNSTDSKGYVESVEGGKLYQLNVTISKASGDNVQFNVVDWKPNTIDMGAINGSAE